MIRKLLLIRMKYISPEALDKLAPELVPFVKGNPVPVTPEAWNDAAGLSHYGFVMEGLKLKDLDTVRKWSEANLDATVLDLVDQDEKKKPIEASKQIENALKSVGLRINQAA